jgi:hypothetical protein
MVRRPEYLTREQLDERVREMRARGQRSEAHEFNERWMAARKSMPCAEVQLQQQENADEPNT